MIFRCWKNHTPYNDAQYEATLAQRGSPLVKLFSRVEVGKNPAKKPAQKS